MSDPRRYGVRLRRDDRRYVISSRWDALVENAMIVVIVTTFLYLGWHILRAILR